MWFLMVRQMEWLYDGGKRAASLRGMVVIDWGLAWGSCVWAQCVLYGNDVSLEEPALISLKEKRKSWVTLMHSGSVVRCDPLQGRAELATHIHRGKNCVGTHTHTHIHTDISMIALWWGLALTVNTNSQLTCIVKPGYSKRDEWRPSQHGCRYTTQNCLFQWIYSGSAHKRFHLNLIQPDEKL